MGFRKQSLIFVIELINDLQNKLKNTENAFVLNEYYVEILKKCNGFLEKRGSTIPSFMDRVDVYYSIPIFIKKDSVKIESDVTHNYYNLKLIGEVHMPRCLSITISFIIKNLL